MRELIKVATPILDTLHDGVAIVDMNGIVCYVNDANERITGLKRQFLLENHVLKVVPYSKLMDVITTKKPLTGVKTVVNNHFVLSNIMPIFRFETCIGAISIFRDITELQALNEELKSAKALIRQLENRSMSENFIIGKNKKSREAFHLATKAAQVSSTVLILGESGTGKEIIANYIHNQSDRKFNPFIVVNCAAIPENLIESELFGYEEGAFTGSKKGGKKGLFEVANNGTIFLDEIGDLPISLQPKLLRVLQEKKITRVGGYKEKQIDVRIIAATHMDLHELVANNTFRKDLFFRIAVFPIHLPTLEERKEDIPLFISYFINSICNQLKKSDIAISEDALNFLEKQSYPGNIRELENIIERAIILDEDGIIGLDDLVMEQAKQIRKYKFEISLEEEIFPIEEIERRYIEKILSISDSKHDALKKLNISRATLYRKLNRSSKKLKNETL